MAKELVKENKYFKAFLEKEHKLITVKWLPSTEDLDEEEGREYALLTAELSKEYQPRLWIADNRDFLLVIDPDTQKWADKEITPVYQENGLEKLAMLIKEVPQEEFSLENLSLEQLAEENTQAWELRFFNDEPEAREWLLA